jgi:hypothetical protein
LSGLLEFDPATDALSITSYGATDFRDRVTVCNGRLFIIARQSSNLHLIEKVAGLVVDHGTVTGSSENSASGGGWSIWMGAGRFYIAYYSTGGGTGWRLERVIVNLDTNVPPTMDDLTSPVMPTESDPGDPGNYAWPSATNSNSSQMFEWVPDHSEQPRGAFGATGGIFAPIHVQAAGTSGTKYGTTKQPLAWNGEIQPLLVGGPTGITNHDGKYSLPSDRWGRGTLMYPGNPGPWVESVEAYSDGTVSRGLLIKFRSKGYASVLDFQVLYENPVGQDFGPGITPATMSEADGHPTMDMGGTALFDAVDNRVTDIVGGAGNSPFVNAILDHGTPSVGAGFLVGENVTGSSSGSTGTVLRVLGSPKYRIGVLVTSGAFTAIDSITGGISGTVAALSAAQDDEPLYQIVWDLDADGVADSEWVGLNAVIIATGASPVVGSVITGPAQLVLTPISTASIPTVFASPVNEIVAVEAPSISTFASPVNEIVALSDAPPTTFASPVDERLLIELPKAEFVGNAYATCAIFETDKFEAGAEAITTLPSVQMTFGPTLNCEGNAFTVLKLGLLVQADLDGSESNADTTLAAGFQALIDLDTVSATATAVLSQINRLITFDAAVNAEATTYVKTSLMSGFAAAVNAEATTGLETEVFKETVASSITIANSAVFQMTVAGTVIDMPAGLVCPDELSVSYDGKELSFSEIAPSGISNPSFSPEDAVTLDVDLGSGLFRWFTGAIRVRETIGQNSNDGFAYTALGFHNLCSEITVINTDGRPEMQFTVGTTVTSIRSDTTEVVTIFSKTIREAMQELFDINAGQLSTAGIPATIGLPGLEQFTSQIPETVRFENVSFSQAIADLAALETGVKPFFNDQQLKWNFPNLLTAPTGIVKVNSLCMPDLVFDVNTEDRYTAVRLLADVDEFLDEAIASKTSSLNINGVPGFIERTQVTLTEKWLPELELDWTIEKALAGDLGTLEDENFWVYKRWSLPQTIAPEWPGTPVRIWQKINFWGSINWRRVHGKTLFRRREFISRFPMIHRGNPHVPGDVIGPLEVKMAYYPRQFNFTFVSTTNSAGTPTLATTAIEGADLLSDIRVPETGYTGTAYTQFGVQRELAQIVSRTAVTSLNASALLRLHKDVVIAGDLPIEGDPIENLLNLDRKILVQHDAFSTGIESLPALLTGYSYTFGKRGLNTFSLTTDVGGLIAGT